MGNTATTPAPPVMAPPPIRDGVFNEEEWHIFEFHIPTVISGGTGLVVAGLALCCCSRMYKRWLLRAHRQNEERMANYLQVRRNARALALAEEGDGDSSAPPETRRTSGGLRY